MQITFVDHLQALVASGVLFNSRVLGASSPMKLTNIHLKLIHHGMETNNSTLRYSFNNIIKDIPNHDILAGFPCQPFSLAGFQKNSLGKIMDLTIKNRGIYFSKY